MGHKVDFLNAFHLIKNRGALEHRRKCLLICSSKQPPTRKAIPGAMLHLANKQTRKAQQPKMFQQPRFLQRAVPLLPKPVPRDKY